MIVDVVTSVLVILTVCKAYQLTIGPCPVHIDEPCDSGVIKFYLYQNSSHTDLLDPFKPKLPSYFNTTTSTKIIIHGYSGNMDFATSTIVKAYIDYKKVNVITVDWNVLAQLPCYPTAVVNTWHAGQCTAVMMVSLASLGIDPRTMHVLGFSLGAHVASYAGNWIFSTMGIKVGRITGLDPALPFFATLKADWKLDSSDADFVDIIHTNSGIYGKVEATGHIDFYVNGGTFQPACANHKNPPICSHMLAPIYFAESISSPSAFQGVRCSGYLQYMVGWCSGSNAFEDNSVDNNGFHTAIMGENCSTRARGVYFVETVPITSLNGNRKH
ncbi:uncharacterized protein CBL_00606 [Carabus blaptoides fortunei]